MSITAKRTSRIRDEKLLAAVMSIPANVTLVRLELAYIAAVTRTSSSRVEASQRLGISTRCLQYKLKEADVFGFDYGRRDPEYFHSK
jgi:DNA-binding NtrC family response regulator